MIKTYLDHFNGKPIKKINFLSNYEELEYKFSKNEIFCSDCKGQLCDSCLNFKNEDIFECAMGLYDSNALQERNLFIKVTKKEGSYLIPAGTPLYQIYPIKTGSFTLQYSEADVQDRENYLMDKVRATLKRYNKNKFKYRFK